MLYRGGFFSELCKQLESLDYQYLERINRPGGLEISSLLDFSKNPPENTVAELESAIESEITHIDKCNSNSFTVGSEDLAHGRTAHCIWVDYDAFLPFKGAYIPVLEMQILRISSFAKRAWVVCPPDKVDYIEKYIHEHNIKNVEIFPSYETFYFLSNGLLDLKEGVPNFACHGSGDALETLRRSGRINTFLSEGGKSIVITSANNMLGGIRNALVGHHNLNDFPVTCEIVPRKRGEKYGALAHYNGFNQVIEPFRFLNSDEENVLKYSSTETYVVNTSLDFDNFSWNWNRTKENIQNRALIKHSRFLSSLTEHFKTNYVLDRRDFHHMSIDDYTNFLNEANNTRKNK